MSSLINRIAELSPEKRALLLQRLNQKTENINPIKITRQSRNSNCFPLSFAQQRLWFFDQLDPGNPTYNICSVGRVTGKLNAIALEQSLNEIIRRHEILRTNFKLVDGKPAQIIAPSLKLTIPVIDLREIPESRREEEVQLFVNREAERPFNLQEGSLLRVSLLHLNESEYLLVFCMHHIISDGWSAGILIQELATLYTAFAHQEVSSNVSTPLPELNIQYADFAVWQRQWLQGKELENQLEYWTKQLGGDLPILNLPSDRARPAVQTFQGAVEKFVLPPKLTQALTELSQRQGATLFMALLAAFNILLYRYTGQEDILVGTPIANRQRQEIEKLIGLFTNTLVMRTDLSGTPTFKDLLVRVRETALGAYQHQDLPFEKLVEVLHPHRNLSHNPIFQVLFGLRNIAMPTLELPEVTLTPEELERKTSRFDLSLDLWEEADGISGVFEYSTDLFEVSTIQRMAGHFQTLLESIVANPDCPIATLPLLTATEQQQILVDWNNTQTNYSENQCLHQLIEQQAKKSPEKIAVVFADQEITYKELNQRANQLAHYLKKLGVKPEIPVGICVERSFDMVIGLLGILKAGGAYVPLDPAYANERLQFMLEDAQVQVLLTQKPLDIKTDGLETVYLDADWDKISQESVDNPVNEVTPDNLAYIIYTSGSTGKPKGVQVKHHSVVHLFVSTRPIFNFEETDVWTVFHSYAFDFSVWEIWGALVNGSKLVIVPQKLTNSPAELYKLLCQEQVTVLNQTPSAIRQLIPYQNSGENCNLRIICCGGEALPADLASELLQWNIPLWNFYGPTEATVWAAINEVQFVESKEGAISIGRPLPNTQLYILDANLQPVPVGVLGELHIGGAGLSRGYLNRPELTAEKFISNPFLTSPLQGEGNITPPSLLGKWAGGLGSYLYKTGDLARYLPDGTIEFFGRIDHQVKIRGFRIELGEIEAVLSQHPEVKQVVVIAREDNPGDKRIVAYIIPNVETLHTNSLRGFLKEKLPEYMIPSAFVLLEAIPVNTNGKIDRRALPAPDTSRHNLDSNFVAPRNPTEEIIADIWMQVLGIQQVSIDDNFFDLGGHSLLATQVISRLREAFGVELPLRYLFESPTIAGLGDAVKGGGRSQRILNNNAQKHQIPPIKRISRQSKLPLSFAQERLWFLDQLTPGDPAYNIPSAVRLQGVLNIAALEQSLNEIIKRHEVLRTSFNVVQEEPVQIIAETLTVSLPVVNLQNLPATEQEQKLQQLATAEAQRPFDLTQAPLLRVTLIGLGETEYAVLFTMHHIISDRWSIGVLVQELAVLYTSFSAGKPSPLTELPIQYADFAVWQRNWLETITKNGRSPLQEQLDYWKQQLGSKLPVLKFPEQLPTKPLPTFQAATHSFTLSADLTAKLNTLSRQENATLFMTLLAALNTLLHRYTGADDIAIATDVANRNRAEIEPLIGFFINILILRSDLSSNPTFRELLQQVREKSLGAYAHQDLPFNKLVLLQPERKSSQAPLFQVLFVLQNTPMPALDLPGITLTPLEVGNETAKFDLVLFAEETETGIIGTWKYNTDLFECSTISRLSQYFETLLASISAQPDAKINTLEIITESEKMTQLQEQQQRQEANRKKFKSVKPKVVTLPQEELIKTAYFYSEEKLPLVITPNAAEIDLIDWAKNNRLFIEGELLKQGAILFRGFNTNSVTDFENFAQAICSELFAEYGDLPREELGGKVYGSTPYPADKAILFHNESSHMHKWPMKIWFYCVQPAQERGETPIVDCRKIYQLLDHKIRDKFAEKGLMYVRNYTNGLDVSWQDFFHTHDKSAVENFCNQNGIELEWKADGGLKTKEIRQAIAKHPKTGEWLFFNQIELHHIAYLDASVRESLLSLFSEENLPRNVYYGDGSPIEQSVIDEVTAIYEQAKVEFPWQQGDVLMLDNMLTAHGRNSFVGARKIVVAMGEIVNSKDVLGEE
ncbi:amino acid adenylation domain protein [Crinalium epipsammum PCC 9333]|uniref:Amino acid adenylation domain protein n=1 Tax=Crinalium epipsammum PCC 9333 TaxID=1173022 RepID=K9VVR1_9CYAN|nr:non-ribosomal peptide synthetase [Crinalium epipsammum]AFZ11270.1 amino acid adenylation domain protein [Crinalium epipsammum PCC 9333]